MQLSLPILMLKVNKKAYLKSESILLQDDGLRDVITSFQKRLLADNMASEASLG